MTNITVAQVIQAMLAPGLMISACGLLLLGLNNKYSLVVNRIRLLTDERRKILNKAGNKSLEIQDNVRVESLSIQIQALAFRVKLVKNAVLSYTIAVAFFVLTSLFIGIEYASGTANLSYVVTLLFLLGMISVLAGVAYGAYETKKGYDIIQVEINVYE